MTAICIAGMHRSGTSMVAQLLYRSGVSLGPEDKITGAAYSNPDGFWEHVDFMTLNDEILAKFGGGWDFPPEFPNEWYLSPALKDIRNRAENLIASFSDQETWGWKDPRNSLTLPFWKLLIPDLKILICLRSPIEIYKSLQKRATNSKSFSFSLWSKYSKSILSNIQNSSHLVTNYHSYFIDPFTEMSRVIDFVGLKITEEDLKKAITNVVKPSLFNNRDTLDELLSIPDELLSLYINLLQGSNQETKNMESSTDTLTKIYVQEKELEVKALSTQNKEKEDLIKMMSAQNVEKEQIIQTLSAQVAEKEQTIHSLITQLQEFQNSRSWRFILALQQIRSLFRG